MANERLIIATKSTVGPPLVSDLEVGEQCWHVLESKMYIRDSVGVKAQGGGVGGGAPTELLVLSGAKTSGQNINGSEGSESDLTWDVVSQEVSELTTFLSGNSKIVLTNSGWINIHASAYISNGAANNRTIISLSLYHYSSLDVLKYSYHGDMQYNRDDNNAYDSSGGSVSQNMMKVEAGDYIYIRTRVFDDGTAASSMLLDSTYSKIRIARVVF